MKPALHVPRIGKTLLAAAFVAMAGAGCATDQSLLGKLGGVFGAPAEAKTAAAGKPIEGDIDAAKALAYLYGEVHKDGRGEDAGEGAWPCPHWALRTLSGVKDQLGEDLVSPKEGNKKVKACAVLAEKYTEQDKEKYMLLTITRTEIGSTANAAEMGVEENGGLNRIFIGDGIVIGASIFTNDGGQWKLTSHKDFVNNLDVWAGVLPGHTSAGGEGRKPGLLLHHFQIERCPGHWLSAFMPSGNNVQEFRLGKNSPDSPLGDDDYQLYSRCETEPIAVTAKVSYDASSQGDYPDIIVDYKKFLPKRGKEIWRFQNGKYQSGKAKKGGAKKRK